MKPRLAILLVGVVLLGGCTLFTAGPVARFTVSPSVLYAGSAVMFDASASSSSDPIVSYGWSFSDGGSAYGRTVNHTFVAPGHYTVTLSVTDTAGRHAVTSQPVTVYMHNGTVLLSEDFSDGTAALARWPLDPAWASVSEGWIEDVHGTHGFVLHIKSGIDRWQRRYTPITLPPLHAGQRLVVSIDVKTAQTQDDYGFFIFPGVKTLATNAGALPYFHYSGANGGSLVCTPATGGHAVEHAIPFLPHVYQWYTYTFVYTTTDYEVYVNGVRYFTDKLPPAVAAGGKWLIVLGDASMTEACDTYYDNLRVQVEG